MPPEAQQPTLGCSGGASVSIHSQQVVQTSSTTTTTRINCASGVMHHRDNSPDQQHSHNQDPLQDGSDQDDPLDDERGLEDCSPGMGDEEDDDGDSNGRTIFPWMKKIHVAGIGMLIALGDFAPWEARKLILCVKCSLG
ncbi:hypothetical protein QAD02_005429 [Eretmocerus hayati]|uniref:Uncharacterized protein n=1 Tax=Eretmocerus hayati TaxID=131215 RepID=A0ACC2NSS4_9HYME|nr:hypothetical protein QAD02_005429 [Eretmocerus hayati]